jgi:2-amino-4-hydroxy-6-hydroxymethyldihydropteridine diphosphokinase
MILIAFGGNLSSRVGMPAQTIRAALNELSRAGVVSLAVSRLYSSPAWPDPADPSFINGVLSAKTELSPEQLLDCLHATERRHGRERNARNAPRTLDLDILDYNGEVQSGPPELPHPRLEDRAFVLIPMRDVAPGWRHPVSGRSLDALIAALSPADRNAVKPVSDR